MKKDDDKKYIKVFTLDNSIDYKNIVSNNKPKIEQKSTDKKYKIIIFICFIIIYL